MSSQSQNPAQNPAQSLNITVSSPHAAERAQKLNWVRFWVLFGAGSSFAFMALIMMTVLGHFYLHWIPLWAFKQIVVYWPFVCLGYILFTQLPPMLARYLTMNWEEHVDNTTSWFPAIGNIIVFAAMAFAGFWPDADGWRFMVQNVLTSLIDIALTWVGARMVVAQLQTQETKTH